MLLFIIAGLPIYTTSLSVAFHFGGKPVVWLMQLCKEVVLLTAVVVVILGIREKPKFLLVDKLVMAFMALAFIYACIPLGGYSFVERLVALKALAFFPLLYVCGRFMPLEKVYIKKIFTLIAALSLAAGLLVVLEWFFNIHFQTFSGYNAFNNAIYQVEESGNYGLTWTFEIENGTKRFASFFSNPLDHAAATIFALAVLAGLYTGEGNRLHFSTIGWMALLATLASILFALSRAAFISYFIVVFLYSLITKRKEILALFYLGAFAVVIYILFFTGKDFREFVINTIQFTNASSVGHLLEWLAGLEAMAREPLGLGLGTSGRISALAGDNVGGENQFIITGVQTGVAGLLLYLSIHVVSFVQAIRWYPRLQGKEQQICLTLILAKAGLFIPMFTANMESYLYVAYMLWIVNGWFVQVVGRQGGRMHKAGGTRQEARGIREKG
ncbi:MAG: hypothetical protein RLY85_912 [Bacteroidota bacterium]